MSRSILLKLLTIFAFTLVGSTASAQTVIKGGTVHTAAGDPIENATVVIGADGTIVAVGVDAQVPEGASVIDATGKVVTPGFIEASSALGLVEIGAVDGSNDTAPEDLDQDHVLAAVRAVDAFNPASAVIPVQRIGGVTSVVSFPGRGVVSGQSLWADLHGEGAFATVVNPFVGLHGSATRWTVRATGNSRATLWLTFRELIDDATFFAANQAAFDQNNSRKLQASRLDLAAFGQVLDGSKPLVLSVHRAADIRTAVRVAKENGMRLVIDGGAEAWMVKDLLAAEKIPVLVEPLRNLPSSFEQLGARADNAKILHEAGVPLVIASHSTHNARNLRQMAGNAVRAGLPWDAALRAITVAPAEAYGMSDRYGTLEPGKVGNVVVWSGDPFEFSSKVEHMFIGGEPTSLDNRQLQLFERYRSLERRGDPLPYPTEKKSTESQED